MDDFGESHANGIHLLRTMQQHHVSLSAMADTKANILIGVNSVIFALVMRESAAMTPPLLVLAACSATAAILCMIAVVPSIGPRLQRHEMPPNLLFFGSFTNMSEAEFQARIDAVTTNDVEIRHAMIRDVYQLGQVLRRGKYRYIAWGYRTFAIGIAATLLTYLAELTVLRMG